MNSVADKQIHAINISMRKQMSISGVKEVESFDEFGAVLQTYGGELTIEGKDIKIGTLDGERGIVELEGRIDAVFYSDTEDGKRRGFFGKLSK